MRSKSLINTFTTINFTNILTKYLNKNIKYIIDYKQCDHDFIDIIDSNFYKSLDRENYISLLIYTDGIQLTNSNCLNFWPVLVIIVEMPFKLRQAKSHHLLYGVWSGYNKPSSKLLLASLQQQLQEINNTGLYIDYEDAGLAPYTQLYVSFQFYGLCADTVAKNHLLNMSAHNGNFGCPYCLINGIKIYYF